MVLSKKIGRLEEAVTIKEEETDKLCKSLVIINIKKFMAIFLFSDRSCKYSITAWKRKNFEWTSNIEVLAKF